MVNSKEDAKERLNQNNADDIYDSLKKLKGSALQQNASKSTNK